MTQEQREHIAATIGILDMASAVLKDLNSSAGDVVGAQCEILQEVLDDDLRGTVNHEEIYDQRLL